MRYQKRLADALRGYFSHGYTTVATPEELPTFSGFRRTLRMSLPEFERFLSHKDFALAASEAKETRRDLLKLGALTKRFDPSFVKYLLDEGEGDGGDFSVEIGEV